MILRAPVLAVIAAVLALFAGSGVALAAKPAVRPPAARLLDAQVIPRQPGPLAPRDDCANVAGARAFRMALARAVTAKDTAALVALATPEVQLGFGGDNGTAWLRRNASARDGMFWTNLADAVSLGCAVEKDGLLVMPWIFAQDPGELDPFDAMLVRGTGVALRDGPSAGAKVLRRLDWQFVEFVGPWQADARFVKVRTMDRIEGYIPMAAQRGITETRVIAERTRAGWKITAIVAGD